MNEGSGERVFVIRIRRCPGEGSVDTSWRGSVHDVESGRRFYVSSAHDIAEFIGERMAEADLEER